MDARPSFEGNHRAVGGSPMRSGTVPDPAAAPSSARWNSRPETDKWLAEHYIGSSESGSRYRIEGWLAQCGTSVWFGAGSTGKTQLMLWMTAMLASRAEDRPAPTWLGGTINGSGHVLVLTAEDNREQVMGRLRDVVEHALGQAPDAMARTCARIHVMPFLSMAKGEFDHPNPSLFQNDRQQGWMPSAVMEEVGRYVREWNKLHPAVDDQIIGVVMGSATSMAGFDSMDAQGGAVSGAPAARRVRRRHRQAGRGVDGWIADGLGRPRRDRHRCDQLASGPTRRRGKPLQARHKVLCSGDRLRTPAPRGQQRRPEAPCN